MSPISNQGKGTGPDSQHLENCLTSDTGKLLRAQVLAGFLMRDTLLLMTTMGYYLGELCYLHGHQTRPYPLGEGKKTCDDSPALIPNQVPWLFNYCRCWCLCFVISHWKLHSALMTLHWIKIQYCADALWSLFLAFFLFFFNVILSLLDLAIMPPGAVDHSG